MCPGKPTGEHDIQWQNFARHLDQVEVYGADGVENRQQADVTSTFLDGNIAGASRGRCMRTCRSSGCACGFGTPWHDRLRKTTHAPTCRPPRPARFRMRGSLRGSAVLRAEPRKEPRIRNRAGHRDADSPRRTAPKRARRARSGRLTGPARSGKSWPRAIPWPWMQRSAGTPDRPLK